MFIVVASLFTSIFFKPIGALFDLPDSYVSPGVLFLGCAGAVLCVIEKVRMPLTADISERDSRLSGSSSSTSDHVASDTAQFGTEPTAVTLWGASRQPVSPVYNALEVGARRSVRAVRCCSCITLLRLGRGAAYVRCGVVRTLPPVAGHSLTSPWDVPLCVHTRLLLPALVRV